MEKQINRTTQNTYEESIQINTNSNLQYDEKLIKNEEGSQYAMKTFNIEIISKRFKLYQASLNFDFQNRETLILTDEIEVKIKFIDILGFIPESRMSENTYLQIKNEFKQNSQIETSVFTSKVVAHLNYFPIYKLEKCNCFGWICCNCSETIVERRAKNIELLIPIAIIEEISEVFNKIMLEDSLNTIQLTQMNKRKLLLFINPFGGKGTVIKIWNQVKKIFALSYIEIEVLRTGHCLHAYEHTLRMDFRQYQGVLCCSGDGIVHEVINAMFHREDKEEFINSVPVGVIPGGSANGYAKSLCEASGEVCTPENCAYIISKGQVKDVDVLEIETPSREKKIYSFLSIAWGIIADIDLESEAVRCCGPFRFTLYGALRWMCLRESLASLYYLPQNSSLSLDEIPSLRHHVEYTENESSEIDGDSIFIRENNQFSYFWACKAPWTGETYHTAPKAKLDDGFCDLIKMKRSAGKCNLLAQLLNQDNGDYYDQNGELRQDSGLEYVKTKCWRLIPKTNLHQNDDSNEERNLNRFYSIDGERYPIEPIQVKTLRKSLRIFCLNTEN